MRLYGVLSLEIDEVVEWCMTREEAEAIVGTWDTEEPDQAGRLQVVEFEFAMSPN